MPSLREIRRKIKSVKSTQKITKAMKMVAAARMRRAQLAILASRPFAVKMEEAVRNLALLEIAGDIGEGRQVQIHSFFDSKPGDHEMLVLVTGDKALCGAFNSQAIRAAITWIKERSGKKMTVAIVGKKAREFIHRLKDFQAEMACELVGIFPKVSFVHAEMLGKAVIEAYEKKGCVSIDVIFNEFRSVAIQKVSTRRILPIPMPEQVGEIPDNENERKALIEKISRGLPQYKFEPRREKLLESLLPRFIKAQLYRVMLESQAAELAARMNAMDAAAKNAGELIDSLTLGLNRTRQSIITGEIAELVGGAEALAS